MHDVLSNEELLGEIASVVTSKVVAVIVLYYVLEFFWLLLMARVITELLTSFVRGWHPRGVLVVILEFVFTVTDPPVKLARRLVPPISLGQVRLDISIMVLMVLIFIGLNITAGLAS